MTEKQLGLECPNEGFFYDYDPWNGAAERVQCQFCHEEPRSRFNLENGGKQ